MIDPSEYFKESVSLCGEPGAEFVREQAAWTRPALVNHPTIRRIDWNGAAEPWPGRPPERPLEASDGQTEYNAEIFVWARSLWRGFFAPQLGAIVPWRDTSFDARECHPFTFGYVRGALWELVGQAGIGESGSLTAFVALAATADLFGLEWIDDIERAIDDLNSYAIAQERRLAFLEGARRGIEEMENYLSGTDLEPRGLVEWFEAADEHALETETDVRGLVDGSGTTSSDRFEGECS
jgi:hypothetical protein